MNGAAAAGHAAAARRAAEAAARDGYGKLLAYLARRCGSVEAAEDALAEAFAAALERWPVDGVPHAPEAWLLVAARNRLFDRARRERYAERSHERLVLAAREAQHAFENADELSDDRLGVMFACAHPAISVAIRAPLILQAVLGLDAARIAAAFLVAPATMSQRLVRAKHKIAASGVSFETPKAAELSERLDAVLAAIYTVFAQGWDDPTASDPRSRGLVEEAIALGKIAYERCPTEPEAAGLLALMLFAHARDGVRRAPDGAYVPLEQQDIAGWDHGAIDEAERLLRAASAAGRSGRFQLEAAIQSAHSVRRGTGEADWTAIVALYDSLLRLTLSPVVALNRAVAIGKLRGAAAGLEALEAAAVDTRLLSYQPYWAAAAELSAQCGDTRAALVAFERALGLTMDPSVRAFLANRINDVTRSVR